MIYKVTSEDGRKMQILSILTRQLIDFSCQPLSQLHQHVAGIVVIGLYETGNIMERNRLLFLERLHRIENTIMKRHAGKHVHVDRTCCMKKDLRTPARTERLHKIGQHTVLH